MASSSFPNKGGGEPSGPKEEEGGGFSFLLQAVTTSMVDGVRVLRHTCLQCRQSKVRVSSITVMIQRDWANQTPFIMILIP